MKPVKRFVTFLTLLTLTGCGSTYFVSTWHDPNAGSIDLTHKQVAAFLLSGNTAVRRTFESNLAINSRDMGLKVFQVMTYFLRAMLRTRIKSWETSAEPKLMRLYSCESSISRRC
jgi:hypothetical protein